MKHVLIKEPAGWHCLCCSKNFPLADVGPTGECPVYTLYCEAKKKLQSLPDIINVASWNDANKVLTNNLVLLMALDEQMSDGLQATKRRFPLGGV